MGNSAIPVNIGVEDIDTVLDSVNGDITASGVALIPTSTWTQITSGTPATIDTALSNAGYIKGTFEFVSGTKVSVRIPCFTTA